MVYRLYPLPILAFASDPGKRLLEQKLFLSTAVNKSVALAAIWIWARLVREKSTLEKVLAVVLFRLT